MKRGKERGRHGGGKKGDMIQLSSVKSGRYLTSIEGRCASLQALRVHPVFNSASHQQQQPPSKSAFGDPRYSPPPSLSGGRWDVGRRAHYNRSKALWRRVGGGEWEC
ncbi:hypothetical protein OUZ56_017654 [Daphnia magna]|uniref:Uncharacterized protein n=1 Tax=Daphnia magna TaxID=35525 RepID=A0ABR0ATD2_9CRUS|nr:hypothetical protein OUZ56_017654 [Daphnia magna]